MNCETCSKKNGCTWQAKVDGKGCRAWEGVPCEPKYSDSRVDSLVHDLRAAQKRVQELEDELAENRPDLAIWWEAYRAALSGAESHLADSLADSALRCYKIKVDRLRKI